MLGSISSINVFVFLLINDMNKLFGRELTKAPTIFGIIQSVIYSSVSVTLAWLMPLPFFLLNQKEHLKVLLSAKDREEGARGPETVKVQLRSTLVSDLIGKSVHFRFFNLCSDLIHIFGIMWFSSCGLHFVLLRIQDSDLKSESLKVKFFVSIHVLSCQFITQS